MTQLGEPQQGDDEGVLTASSASARFPRVYDEAGMWC
jgi:hypothetical protein